MKKIQKKLSVVLAVMMVLCMFTALPFSASAAETSEETSAGNKINVTSNVADPVSYDYNAQTKQVVVFVACIVNVIGDIVLVAGFGIQRSSTATVQISCSAAARRSICYCYSDQKGTSILRLPEKISGFQ